MNTEDLTLTVFPIYRDLEYKIILKYENPIYNDITHNNGYDYYLDIPGSYSISPNLNTNTNWSFYTRIKQSIGIPLNQTRYIVSGNGWGVYIPHHTRMNFQHHTKNVNDTIFFVVGGGLFIYDHNISYKLIITRNDNHMYIYMYNEETKEIRKGYLPQWPQYGIWQDFRSMANETGNNINFDGSSSELTIDYLKFKLDQTYNTIEEAGIYFNIEETEVEYKIFKILESNKKGPELNYNYCIIELLCNYF